MNDINKSFNADSVEAIVENLKNSGSEWATKTVGILSKMSPTSMKITLKLLQLGGEMDLQECLGIEYRLAQRCCEDHDFIEGILFFIICDAIIDLPLGYQKISKHCQFLYFLIYSERCSRCARR